MLRRPLMHRYRRLVRFMSYRRATWFIVAIAIVLLFRELLTGEDRLPPASRVGLEVNGDWFYLNGQPVRILSGAMHYFRVPRYYWLDRLRKLRAAGLNTVETYVAWNRHEEVKGHLDFIGDLDLHLFVELAHSVGLYVIIRPGPYICAEWDLGGLPSWLLSEPGMVLRSSQSDTFLNYADRYLAAVLAEVSSLQYSFGGPIIAFQVENEYGSYALQPDGVYLKFLADSLRNHGVVETLFTSDGTSGQQHMVGSLQELFKAVNFKGDAIPAVQMIRSIQPHKPAMVGEYWTGWFDHWGENHHTDPPASVMAELSKLLQTNASFNLYMFHGGTNFAFWNGANQASDNDYAPTVTSYDYDAPLSESGDVTDKLFALRDLLAPYAPSPLPPLPPDLPKATYGVVQMNEWLSFEEAIAHFPSFEFTEPVPMERLMINNGGGQGYGFILYRHVAAQDLNGMLRIPAGVHDRAIVLVDGKENGVLFTNDAAAQLTVSVRAHGTLDILVENCGRVNFQKYLTKQMKGLHGAVLVDQQEITGWRLYPLEFKPGQIVDITNSRQWMPLDSLKISSPVLFRATWTIDSEPRDTFLHLPRDQWSKGVAFINTINLGRYWAAKGPQKALYVPAPFLRYGINELIIFELHSSPAAHVEFLDHSLLG